MACQCRILANGEIVVCDSCASTILATVVGLGVSEQDAAELPSVLTSAEYAGLQSAVNGYFEELEKGRQA